MTVLDAHMYGNPETVLERKQEAERRRAEVLAQRREQCGPCVHSKSIVFNGKAQDACGKRHHYGTRCRHFEESTP